MILVVLTRKNSKFLQRKLELYPIWQFSKIIFVFGGFPEIYIQSAPNNSNETHTFMCLGRAGRFGQH